jgi:flap endonuclease-1
MKGFTLRKTKNMGIKGLSKFLKEHIPASIKTVQLSSLSGRVIAIDANYYMYKYTISSDDYTKKFANQYFHLMRHNIKPLYVFDGKPPSEKQKVIDKRKIVNKKKNIEITNTNIKTLKEFFNANGITYLECEAEADFICSKLSSEGVIHGCISDDMDFLTLGCRYLYRDYYQYQNEIVEYSLDEVLKVFTHQQVVDISIFLGCDYCDRIYDFVNRSIQINVFELFKEYGTLENVWNYLMSTDKFLYVDAEKEKAVQEKWPKAREILNNQTNFNFDRVKNKAVGIIKVLGEKHDVCLGYNEDTLRTYLGMDKYTYANDGFKYVRRAYSSSQKVNKHANNFISNHNNIFSVLNMC